MMYVLGLGNPGSPYAGTRHNIGRDIVAAFAREHGFPEFHDSGTHQAKVSSGSLSGEQVTLALPQVFMNRSGETAKSFALEAGFSPERLMVVHDELDLPLGTIRAGFDSGSAGHNGVKSIIEMLGTQSFCRLRIGIAPLREDGSPHKPQGEEAVSRFVLAAFNSKERAELLEAEKHALGALQAWIESGMQAVMRAYN
jgi:PTH1 family peptidyl-tRNA hydrolase